MVEDGLADELAHALSHILNMLAQFIVLIPLQTDGY